MDELVHTEKVKMVFYFHLKNNVMREIFMKLYVNDKEKLKDIKDFRISCDSLYCNILHAKSKYERNYIDIEHSFMIALEYIEKIEIKKNTIKIKIEPKEMDNCCYSITKTPSKTYKVTLEELELMVNELSNGRFEVSKYTDGSSPAAIRCLECGYEITFRRGGTIYNKENLEKYKKDEVYYSCTKCYFIELRERLVKFLNSYKDNVLTMYNNFKEYDSNEKISLEYITNVVDVKSLCLTNSFYTPLELILSAFTDCELYKDRYKIRRVYNNCTIPSKLIDYVKYSNSCLEKYGLEKINIEDYISM